MWICMRRIRWTGRKSRVTKIEEIDRSTEHFKFLIGILV
jgi:hypothetical protein